MNTKLPKGAGFPMEGGAPMDQVRDLLFGTQMKEMDTRLLRLEERFSRSVEDAKSTLKNRIDAVETFMKSEVSSLLAKLKEEQIERDETIKAEQKERIADLTKLSKELASAIESSDRKLAKLASTLDTTERELRQLLLSESGTIRDTIEDKYQNSLTALKNTAGQIRHDMVHRATLAGLFTETAVKLNGQWAEVEKTVTPQVESTPPPAKNNG